MSIDLPQVWAIVPAAGIGARMAAELPKQYLPVAGKPILLHTLSRLQRHPRIASVVVALNDGDRHWESVRAQLAKPVLRASGGSERAGSVFNALAVIADRAAATDWALVHDAARPCVRSKDISNLLAKVEQGGHAGGLLALPVRDTMKRANADQLVVDTVSRSRLWHALTPQLFRVGALREALDDALQAGFEVTDEASAMEHQGVAPLLVAGHPDNIKITHPADLEMAELFLAAQEREQ